MSTAHVVLASGTNITGPKVSLPARVAVLLTSTNIRASVKELSLNNCLFFSPWQTIICRIGSKCESYLRTASWSGSGPVTALVQLGDNPMASMLIQHLSVPVPFTQDVEPPMGTEHCYRDVPPSSLNGFYDSLTFSHHQQYECNWLVHRLLD